MKELIRMNQLAGLITEGQARKMLAVLDEGKQVGDLYHFTYAGRLPYILNQNTLKAIRADNKARYVSFTRNKNLFLNPSRISGDFESALVIDGDKLSNNYKIEPYSDSKSKKDESEERVVIIDSKKEGIDDIKKYIKKIIILGDKFSPEEIKDIEDKIRKEINNIDIEIIYKKEYPIKKTNIKKK